jgi:hypothetical protein
VNVGDWREQALCATVADPDAWYADAGPDRDAAVATCVRCPVQENCLDWAMDHGEQYGVWAGMTPEDRWDLGMQPDLTLVLPDHLEVPPKRPWRKQAPQQQEPSRGERVAEQRREAARRHYWRKKAEREQWERTASPAEIEARREQDRARTRRKAARKVARQRERRQEQAASDAAAVGATA